MSSITLSTGSFESNALDSLIIGVRAGSTDGPFARELGILGLGEKPGSTAVFPAPESMSGLRRVVAVRLGAEPTPSQLRLAAANGRRAAPGSASIGVALSPSSPDDVQAIAEGLSLGEYRFTRYKSNANAAEPASIRVFVDGQPGESYREAVDRGRTVASAVCTARDWINTPARDLTPARFAAEIEALAAEHLSVTVWDRDRLVAERCAGLIAVGSGSANESRMVTLSYRPPNAAAHIAFVGKGITFDSGGLSLKPKDGMQTMKGDMAGAAAVAGAVWAIARLGLPVEVTGFAALAENMPGGSAMRPGDVLAYRNGKTVEVLDTDEEGRLVLADALVLAAERSPELIVDLATLTGASAISLGRGTAAIFSNSAEHEALIHEISQEVDEPMWPLPILDGIADVMRSSPIADLRQHSPDFPRGAAIFAAAFLREFVDGRPWIHLDIAPSSFHAGEDAGVFAHGATGVGVRTLIALAQRFAERA